MLRRDSQTHMDVILRQIPFRNLTGFLPVKLSTHGYAL
jgi:hypothetical protein